MEERIMKRLFPRMILSAASAVLAGACGSGDSSMHDDPGAPDLQGASLEILPSAATLTVHDGAPARQRFTVRLRHRDGHAEDITAHAHLSIDRLLVGRFHGPVLTASGQAAGQSLVNASFMGLSADAPVTVHVQRRRIIEPAPPNAPQLLDLTAEQPDLAPSLVYPANQTIVPPNLGRFEVHWKDQAGADLFEVSVSTGFVQVRVYMASPPETDSWVALLPEEWAALAQSDRRMPLSVSVRGMRRAEPGRAGSTAPILVRIADQPLQGGIYFWASRSRNSPSGIYRHDMSHGGQQAEPFYTSAQTPGRRCVACHVISRDGARMAVTYDGGDYSASIIDIATRSELLPLDTYFWNFAAFEPGRRRLLTTYQGQMLLRDADTGEVVSQVADVRYGTHPDFSPAGDAIAFVRVNVPTHDWRFRGGSLMVASFDPETARFGPPVALLACNSNCFYPSWSPDGKWILFNMSSEDAYDDASAELWIIKADGSMPPIRLDAPNQDIDLTNSWARWAPFEQVLQPGNEPMFWFTFSSKRDFGVRLAGLRRPQIWMAPFFPERALRGEAPSAPAFHLPIQSMDSNNHVAQWTEKVVSVESK